MKTARLKMRCTALMACLAILMAALAPSISHGVAALGNTASLWNDICSATGLKQLQAPGEQHDLVVHSSVPAHKTTHLEHCPYCFTHAGSFGLTPAAPLVFHFQLANGAAFLPFLFYQAPHAEFVWSAAQSRAPPLHS